MFTFFIPTLVYQQLFAFINPKLVEDAYIRALKHVSTFHATITVNHNQINKVQYLVASVLKKRSGRVLSEVRSILDRS